MIIKFYSILYYLCPLEIVAPECDFDSSKISTGIKDPIVLKPVIFEGTKYYLIVTAG